MPNVWIAGAGMTRVGRRSEPLGDLMADAAHAALAAAGRERPDFIIVATMNPEEFVGDGNFASNIATYMGFAETPALRVETATSSGAAALYAGVAQVAASLHRTVADPLRLLHCCPISDGAAAVVLTAERSAVRVAGIGQGADALAVRHRADVTHFRATRDAARAAFAMAGFGPARVDFAEIHDAFAPFELISLEDLGLVPPGKAGRATLDGETALDGRLPVNPSGGLKGRGHPLAATGLAQVVECVWQLTGRGGERQVSGKVALAHSIGGLATNNWVTIVEAER